MPSTTAKQQAPYPVGTDAPYVHLDLQALANWAGGRTISKAASTSRPSGSDLYDGHLLFETDTRRWSHYDSGIGRWVQDAGKVAIQTIGGSWTPNTAFGSISGIGLPPGRWRVTAKGHVVSSTSAPRTYNVRLYDATTGGIDAVQVLGGNTFVCPFALDLLVDNTTSGTITTILQMNVDTVGQTQNIGSPVITAVPA